MYLPIEGSSIFDPAPIDNTGLSKLHPKLLNIFSSIFE